eukprot:282509_1
MKPIIENIHKNGSKYLPSRRGFITDIINTFPTMHLMKSFKLFKMPMQCHTLFGSSVFNLRSFSNATSSGQKILEILDSNQHNKPITNVQQTDEIKHINNNTQPLSQYQNEMESLTKINTNQSIINAWKLFQETKTNSNINQNDIDIIYSAAIKLILFTDFEDKRSNIISKKGFNKMIALGEEIQSKNNNETSTVQCDIMIINSCLKVKQYKKIINIYEYILKNKQQKDYFTNIKFCEIMIKCFGESNYVFEGIKFMKDIEIKYEMIPNNEMIAQLLRTIAYSINKDNKMLYLRSVEMLFEQSFGDKNMDKYPNILIYI